MMMQLLTAAGIEPYTDRRRVADEDNPRGYLEHESATRLRRDASWIPEVRGKAVKVVAQLLPYLPSGQEYRIVFMHRDLNEVIASQRAMLGRLDRAGARLSESDLARAYTRQLVQVQTWLQLRPEIPVLPISYEGVLRDPAGAAERLAAFLGQPFDEGAAAMAVDSSVRRQRLSAETSG
jgi:hypothetical protein